MPRVEPAFAWYLRLVLALAHHLPAADAGAVPRADGADHAAVHDQELQVRRDDHRLAAAVLSPDPGGVGMAMMGGPVIILYILSIGLAWLFRKKKKKEEPEEAA